MIAKCVCCEHDYYGCDEYYADDEFYCENFVPDIDKIKEYSTRYDITVLETIALIHLCCKTKKEIATNE